MVVRSGAPTFYFVLAKVDEGRWIHHIAGVVEDHLDLLAIVGAGMRMGWCVHAL